MIKQQAVKITPHVTETAAGIVQLNKLFEDGYHLKEMIAASVHPSEDNFVLVIVEKIV